MSSGKWLDPAPRYEGWVAARLTPEEFARLDATTKRTNMTRSAVVRLGLATVAQMAEKLGPTADLHEGAGETRGA